MMGVRDEQPGIMGERRLAAANERTLTLGVAGVLLALEVVALSGLCRSAIAELWGTFGRWSPQGAPEVGRALAPMLIMYLVSAVHWRGPVFCLAAGLVFAGAVATVGTAGGAPGIFFYNTLAVAALAGIVHMLWQAKGVSLRRQVVVRRLLWGMAMTLLYSVVIVQLLTFGVTTRPLTYDESVYLLDAAYGFVPSRDVALLVGAAPTLSSIVEMTYNWIGAAIVLLFTLQVGRRHEAPVSVLHVMVLTGFLGSLSYHLYPVSGPQFAFPGMFPHALPELEQLRVGMTLTVPAARNGMPSLHFGWALALVLMAWHERQPLVRILYATFVALTAIATLSTGHHYLVDLIVAFPFIVAGMAVCSRHLPWTGCRSKWVGRGVAMYLLWLFALWFAIPTMVDWPLLLWLLSGATVAVSWFGMRELHAANASARAPEPEPLFAATAQTASANRETILVHGLFLVSGAAALIYQVLFSKQLTYVFGSMSTATNSVLATYMAGLALGAWVGGLIGPRTNRPILWYAYIEFAIAIYCALSPQIFDFVQAIYISFGQGLTPDARSLVFTRFGLGALCLIVPTVLMGITLPLLARFFEQRQAAFGVSVGALYAANTVGAALGALMAGYFILPALGVGRTTLVAVLANLFVAGLALDLHKRLGGTYVVETAKAAVVAAVDATAQRAGRAALIILLIGGFITLALEVNYIHLLAVAAGNSTYAFSLMLFAFLIGLGGGAETARRLMRHFGGLQLLAWLELALCVTILLSFRHINVLAEYFSVFSHYPLAYEWTAREFIRGTVCCVAMIPSAFLIGAIFPVAIDCVANGFPERQIRMLGVASALNTLGNIAGVVVGGFIMLPLVGSERGLWCLAATAFAVALYAAAIAGRFRPRFAGAAALTLVLLIGQPTSLNYDVLTTGANVYFAEQRWGHVVDHAESLDGGLTSVNENVFGSNQRVLTLLTNGKFQGNDSVGGEMVAQMGFAMAPMLHTDARDSALVIGYGTGNTSRVLHDAGFARLDVVDLSADIFRLANEYFAAINNRVTEAENVDAYITDGRNFLLLTENTYDLISMEISSIWFAGAASLYSSDFYELAQKRLKPGGVLQQWMQLHHASPIDIYYILGSMRRQFDYVWVYVIGSQGIVVASNDINATPSVEHANAMHSATALRESIGAYGGCAASLAEHLLLAPADTDHFLNSLGVPAEYFDSNDDNAFLEYNTPKGNALDGQKSYHANRNLLAGHATAETASLRRQLSASCAQ